MNKMEKQLRVFADSNSLLNEQIAELETLNADLLAALEAACLDYENGRLRSSTHEVMQAAIAKARGEA